MLMFGRLFFLATLNLLPKILYRFYGRISGWQPVDPIDVAHTFLGHVWHPIIAQIVAKSAHRLRV